MDQKTFVVGVARKGHVPMSELQSRQKKVPSEKFTNQSESKAPVSPECGEHLKTRIAGDLVPWNTFAVWNTTKLARVGFLPDADMQDPPGMEEPVPIALMQRMESPRSAQAKLLHFSDEDRPSWNVDFESEERRIRQVKKMASKNRRTIRQLSRARVHNGEIIHIFQCIKVSRSIQQNQLERSTAVAKEGPPKVVKKIQNQPNIERLIQPTSTADYTSAFITSAALLMVCCGFACSFIIMPNKQTGHEHSSAVIR